MMPDTAYKTSRAPRITRALIRNAALVSLSAALMIWQWLEGGGAMFAVLAGLFASIAAFVLWTLHNSRVPLEITDSHVVIRSALNSPIPLANVVKIGEHPGRKTPSLTYSDPAKGQSGELPLPWTYIAEPQAEVLQKLQAAIDKKRGG